MIKSLLLGLAAATTLPWQLTAADQKPVSTNLPAWLQAVTGNPDAVIRLGRVYLVVHPDEQDAKTLLRLIDAALGRLPGLDAAQLQSPTQASKALKRLVQTDYINDQVVILEEWILSRNEARLYALVTVLHGT
ncbi:MAG: hypothetical protein PVG22_13925 [Chromatiales bacterium]